jgi:hypothetical protein
MGHRFSPFSSFILSLVLLSCSLLPNKDEKGDNVELEAVSSLDGDFSLSIPAYMTKATTLNDDASLQYQNMFKEVYVIVIGEDKQEFINTFKKLDNYDTTRSPVSNYADVQVQATSANMNVISKTDIVRSKINGMRAAATEMDASVEGVSTPITYFLTFFEGKEKMYMIMAWTFQSKKDTYRNTFDKMAKSFKLLQNKPVTAP